QAAQRREVFTKYIPNKPRVWLKDATDKEFGYEITTWRNGDRTYCFVTFNPEVIGNELGGGNSTGLKTDTANITIEFATPVGNVKDERAGKSLPNGKAFQVSWRMNEALVLSYDSPKK